MIKVKVSGVKATIRELKDVRETVLKEKVMKHLSDGANAVRDEAKRLAPVKTGALRESIKARTMKDSLASAVYCDYPDADGGYNEWRVIQKGGKRPYYAIAVEYGTRRTPAQPFLGPAVENKRQEIDAGMEAALKEAMPDNGTAKT